METTQQEINRKLVTLERLSNIPLKQSNDGDNEFVKDLRTGEGIGYDAKGLKTLLHKLDFAIDLLELMNRGEFKDGRFEN